LKKKRNTERQEEFPEPFPFLHNLSIIQAFYLGLHSKQKIIMSDLSAQNHKQIEQAEQQMKKAIQHLEAELIKIRAGRANPNMLDGIVIDYYGNPTPIQQVGNISVTDARTLTIQPWEKNMLQPIERAIINSNIGLTPQNDGNLIRLFLPPLTEERRKEFVKRANGEGEQSKVAIRSIRRDTIEHIKKLQKDGLSEDAVKDSEKEVQTLTDNFIRQIDKHLESKEKEIMSV
jgi:ribosome recycling factor